jgi:general secretion pathway protein A
LPEAQSMSPPEDDYARAMDLKEQGRLEEAVELFHLAARDKSMWFKAYSQVGWCYVKMKEHHAAIQAFRTALDDSTAPQQDMLEVLYVLGRSLESIGKAGQAVEVYHRINLVAPTYRDAASRLREAQLPRKQSRQKVKSATEQHSWITGLVDAVQRLFIGSKK